MLPPSQLSELPASHKNSSNNKGVDNNSKDRTTTTVPGGTFTPWNEAGGKRWKTPAGRGTAGVGGGARARALAVAARRAAITSPGWERR